MNARLNHTTPESLQQQVDTCNAICRLMLETSRQYLDLHLDSMKTSLQSVRQHLVMNPQQDGAQMVQAYSALMTSTLAQMAGLVKQTGSLSSSSQRELGDLLEQSWEHQKNWFHQATEIQLGLLRSVGSALASGKAIV